jgi:hypothetical protein
MSLERKNSSCLSRAEVQHSSLSKDRARVIEEPAEPTFEAGWKRARSEPLAEVRGTYVVVTHG